MANLKWEGLITVPTAGYAMSVTEVPSATSTVTIPAGEYYLTSIGDGTRSLADEIAFQLTSNATLAGTYTVAVTDDTDTASGKLTIAVTGVTSTNITWSNTTFRDIIGFTGTSTGADTTHTGASQCRYLWLPNTGPSSMSYPFPTTTAQHFGMRATDGSFAQAPSGQTVSLKYNTRYFNEVGFNTLLGNKTVIVLESTTNESLEKFYEDVIGEGLRLRFYKDRSDNAVFWTFVTETFKDFNPTPNEMGWMSSANSLWSYSSKLWEYVS